MKVSQPSIQNHKLVQAKNTLERLNQRHTFALTASELGVWEFNIGSGALIWDEQMYRIYGTTANSFCGAYEAWENGLHPEDLPQARKDLEDSLSGKKKFDTKFRVVWPSGEIRTIKAIGDVFYDASGNPTHMFGINSDITEEDRIQKALIQSNNDLQHFTHIASHDLREPCCRQKALSQLILEDFSDSVSDELEGFIAQIDQQASQMLTMIDLFRSLSNIGAHAEKSTLFEMQSTIYSVLEEFAGTLTETRINCDSYCTVFGNNGLVRIMLRNLVSNAMKYGGPDSILSFSTEILNGQTVFVVENTSDYELRDNVDLFLPFVRDTDNPDGQGIGLSICKRVIDVHNGRIWIEPKPGYFCVKYILAEFSDDSQ